MRLLLTGLTLVLWLCALGCGAETPGSPAALPAAPSGLGDLEKPEVFWADPSVIQACDKETGKTTLNWKVEAPRRVEIRVNMPEGDLFALANFEGSKETGDWVKDGMFFYLVDADTKESLAALRVRVTRAGCPN